jgi:hypothetical protein
MRRFVDMCSAVSWLWYCARTWKNGTAARLKPERRDLLADLDRLQEIEVEPGWQTFHAAQAGDRGGLGRPSRQSARHAHQTSETPLQSLPPSDHSVIPVAV